MNFKQFMLFFESSPIDYKVINSPEPAPWLTYVPLGLKQAREAEEKFKKGKMKLIPFLKKQEVGFRVQIDGEEYLKSMDGVFTKKTYPISGFQGSGIGQRELYSPSALKKYTTYLKKNPSEDTDPITVDGGPDNYKVRDGHHRMQAYKNAKRTIIPVWVKLAD
jgi:hypothetical protein